jgi:hypothetical protein
MNIIYAYQADLWCESCAAEIMDELDAAGVEDTGDTGDYPQGSTGGETDCPSNCAHCHRPLEEELTGEGVAYVVGRVKDRLREGTEPGDWRWVDGYYKGMDRNAVLRDWAGELCLSSLSREDARAVALFLHWTRPEREASTAA